MSEAAKEGGLQDGAAAARVAHTLGPIFDERSRVLVLGTMPSPRSREVGFYYGHPQNRFWRVMERLHGLRDHELIDNDARYAFLLAHRIALWDVLAACNIAGASDASIANPEPNDLARSSMPPPSRRFAPPAAKPPNSAADLTDLRSPNAGSNLSSSPPPAPPTPACAWTTSSPRIARAGFSARRRDSVHPNRMTRRHPTSAAHAVE